MTRNQVVCYFRDQEIIAARKQRDNDRTQMKSKGKRLAEDRFKPARGNKPKNRDKRMKTRTFESDPCPKHPSGSHTWGECRGRQQNMTGRRDITTA
jgi:hypothetical protein